MVKSHAALVYIEVVKGNPLPAYDGLTMVWLSQDQDQRPGQGSRISIKDKDQDQDWRHRYEI